MSEAEKLRKSWAAMRKEITSLEKKDRELSRTHQMCRIDLDIKHSDIMDSLKRDQNEEIKAIDDERRALCKKANAEYDKIGNAKEGAKSELRRNVWFT